MSTNPKNLPFPKIELAGLEIQSVIDHGEYEIICQGRYAPIDMDVIVEIAEFDKCPPSHGKGPFKDKARKLEKLNHPNIVRLIAWGVQDKIGYLVFDSEQQKRLVDHIREQVKFSARESLEIVISIAKALQHSHSIGVIHGEIRPSNILFSYDGTVKVRNFCLYDNNKEYVLQIVARRPQYVSPEQIKSIPIDQTCDFYSLGIIFYELLTGLPPFSDKDIREIWRMHLEEEVPPVSDLFPNCPEVDQVLYKMLGKSRKDRYQQAADLIRDLETLREYFPMAMFEKFGRAALRSTSEALNAAIEPAPAKKTPVKTSSGSSSVPLVLMMFLLAFIAIGAFVLYQINKDKIGLSPDKDEEKSRREEAWVPDPVQYQQATKPAKPAQGDPVANQQPPSQNESAEAQARPDEADPALDAPLEVTPAGSNRARDDEIIRQAISQLKSPNIDLRTQVLKSTIKMPSRISIPILEDAMQNNDNPKIRLLANQLRRDVVDENMTIIPDSADSSSTATSVAVRKDVKKPKSHANPYPKMSRAELMRLTKDNDPDIRRLAYQGLISLKDAEIMPLVVTEVAQGRLRADVLTGYDIYRDEGIAGLMQLADSDNPEHTEALIHVLRQINTPNACLALKKIALDRPQWSYRAAVTLADMDGIGEQTLLETLGENRNMETMRTIFLGIKEISRSPTLNDSLLALKDKLPQGIRDEIEQFLSTRMTTQGGTTKGAVNKKAATTILSDYISGVNKGPLSNIAMLIGEHDNEIDDRAFGILAGAGQDAIPLLGAIVHGKYKEGVKLKAVDVLKNFKYPETVQQFITYLEKSKYKENKDPVYDMILSSMVALGDTSVAAIGNSDFTIKQKIDLLAQINSDKSLLQSVQLLEAASGPQLKLVFGEMATRDTQGLPLMMKFLEKTQRKDVQRILGLVLIEHIKPEYLTSLQLIANISDQKTAETCIDAMLDFHKDKPAQLSRVYESLKTVERKLYCMDKIPVTTEAFKGVLDSALFDFSPEVRMAAINAALKSASVLLIDAALLHYPLETEKKVQELYVKQLVNTGKIHPEFAILNLAHPVNAATTKKVTRHLAGLSATDTDSKIIGLALQKNYSLQVKQTIINFLISKDANLTIQSIAPNLLASKEPQILTLYKNTIFNLGTKAAEPLIAVVNGYHSNKKTDHARSLAQLLKSMNIAFHYDEGTRKYVLD